MRRNVLPLVLCAALLVWFLSDAEEVRRTAADALALCARSVIPALFPFLTVTGMLLALGFADWTAPLLSPLMTALFRLPGQAGSAVILGFLGGYPAGARAAADLYRNGSLRKEEAERLLAFCNNANPAFLISVLGGGVFGSVRAGVWLLLIHALSALVTGLLFRGSGEKRETDRRQGGGTRASGQKRDGGQESQLPFSGTSRGGAGFFSVLVESVGNAALAMLRICAFVVFSYILAMPLRKWRGRSAVIAVGLAELFSLTPLLSRDAFGFTAAAAFSAWGGAGVLCQTAAALEGSGLSVRGCAAGKAVQGVVAGALAAGALAAGIVRV